MIDLTGANLVSYLLRVIKDIVDRNPRFKQTLGEVTFPANTMMKWKDAWVSVTSVTTSGTRLSPNYFMCTQIGRAIMAKVGDKNGQFIEWTRETDRTRLTPDAGVYYINVDFFSDQTRDLGLTVQKYRWVEGKLKQAVGSIVYFRPGIDVTTLTLSDAATSLPVEFVPYNSSLGGFAYLITPCQTLICTYADPSASAPVWVAGQTYGAGTVVQLGGVGYVSQAASNVGNDPATSPLYWSPYLSVYPSAGQRLAPLADYWYQRVQSAPVASPSTGPNMLCNIPLPYLSVTFSDQNGYQLRENIDYGFQGPQWIALSRTSPPGATIYANMLVKLNPYYTVGTNPENILQVNMTPTETLAPNQVFIHTTHGNYTNPTVNSDGTLTLPQLLQPGDWMRWEVRIDSGQFQAVAKKWELNSLNVVDPTTIQWTKLDKEGKPQPVPTKWVMAADQSELVGVSQASAGTPVPYNGTPVPITATTIYEGTLTVTAANAYQPGDQVLLGGTAEEFLNGSTVTVATSTASQFTAALARPNYVNNADTGTARGEPRLVFPGLRLAIGDNVVVGDQCAIIVSPTLTETYEVFGSKENLTFTLEIKANDMQTSSNLAEMIKQELLVMRRTNTEADGLTIFEVTRSFVGTARDNSATAPSYVNTVTVTASADWKVYVPLVTRLVSLEVNEVMTVQTDFQGQLQMAPRLEAFGAASFIPYYG